MNLCFSCIALRRHNISLFDQLSYIYLEEINPSKVRGTVAHT